MKYFQSFCNIFNAQSHKIQGGINAAPTKTIKPDFFDTLKPSPQGEGYPLSIFYILLMGWDSSWAMSRSVMMSLLTR